MNGARTPSRFGARISSRYGALALAVAFLAVDAATARGQVVLDNGVTRARFAGRPGATTEVAQVAELAGIEDVARGRPPVHFARAAETGRICGGFALLLRRRDRRDSSFRWIGAEDPAFAVTATPAAAAPDGTQSLTFRFSARELQLDEFRFAMTVVVEWRLRAGQRDLEGRITVETPADAPVYLSQVKFPCLELRRIGDPAGHDELVLPYRSGVLMRDPVDLAASPGFPQRLAGPKDGRPWMLENMALPFLAAYAEATRDGLWFSDDDVTALFRDYEVERWRGADGAPVLELRCRHLPPDLFRSRRFALPCWMKVGPFLGDWVAVAERYRGFLADPANGATFYAGPVGPAANPMAPDAKQFVLHVNLVARTYGDNLDLFARDAADVFRKTGSGGLEIWHGGFDEEFDDFYSHEPFGVEPSFAAAVRSAERRFDTQVAPYVNGSRAVDSDELGVTDPGPLLRATKASAVRLESGAPFLLDQGRLKDVVQCNGAAPWREVLVGRAFDVASVSRSRALYLDAFGATPCFVDGASDPGHAHDHAPGGGNYMFRGRHEQVKELRARAAAAGLPLATIAIEGESLWFLGDADVMHCAPLATPLQDRGNTQRVASARTIPLFRMVADSVRLSDFAEHEPGSPPGRRGWLMAMDVFAFGLVPHWRNEHIDLAPSRGGELTRDDEPYDRYLRRIVRCLRDDGFLRFHEGTLLRAPEFEVEGGAALVHELGPETPPAGGATFIEPWLAQPLVAAAYRSPDGAHPEGRHEVAWIVTNPWIGGGAPTLRLHATLDPASLGVGKAGCQVTLRDDAGRETTTILTAGAPLVLDGQPIAAGEIWRWLFTDLPAATHR